jgi:hypothetical protein
MFMFNLFSNWMSKQPLHTLLALLVFFLVYVTGWAGIT